MINRGWLTQYNLALLSFPNLEMAVTSKPAEPLGTSAHPLAFELEGADTIPIMFTHFTPSVF